MYTVCVLKSLKNGKQYTGFTSRSLQKRLDGHRYGLTAWTSQNGPFELVYSEQFEDKQQALRRESYFKTGQGRRTLKLILEENVRLTPATEFGGG